MDPHDYIPDRIETLRKNSEMIREQAEITNDFDSWSALKLILHSAVVNMYTKVMSNENYFTDYYYIDALAGSGVSTYEGDRCFKGSPIVAAESSWEQFSEMYFIEQDPDYCSALKSRLDFVFSNPKFDIEEPERWEVIEGNANKKVPEIVSNIQNQYRSGGYTYYCFIDNQTLDVDWSTIQSLTPEPWGDLLINLPTSQAIGRSAALEHSQKLNDFYGIDVSTLDIPENGIREFMRQLYIDRLKDRDREVIRSTHVDANVGSFGYDMVYATRDIEDGNDYVNVIDYVKRMVENVHAGDVDNILDILYGGQSTMAEYYPEGEMESEISDSEAKQRDDEQTGLDEWG